jgi:hypothetical protein
VGSPGLPHAGPRGRTHRLGGLLQHSLLQLLLLQQLQPLEVCRVLRLRGALRHCGALEVKRNEAK